MENSAKAKVFILVFFSCFKILAQSENSNNWQIGLNTTALYEKNIDFKFLVKKINPNKNIAFRFSGEFDLVHKTPDKSTQLFEVANYSKTGFLFGIEKRKKIDGKFIFLNGVQIEPFLTINDKNFYQSQIGENAIIKQKNSHIYDFGVSCFSGLEYFITNKISLSTEFKILANYKITKHGNYSIQWQVDGINQGVFGEYNLDRRDFTINILPFCFLNLNYIIK